MTIRLFLFTMALGAAMTMVGEAWAKGALKDEAHVQETMINIGIAYEIGERCDRLDSRKLKGISVLSGLKDWAMSNGYTSDEVKAYVDDKAEKNRLIAIAYERLWAKGAIKGQYETYCAVGDAEIAAGSQIGQLLK